MAKTLTSFSISNAGDGYVLHLEDEEGDTMDFAASFDQLDIITEAIEEALNRDEEDALEVADGAEDDE